MPILLWTDVTGKYDSVLLKESQDKDGIPLPIVCHGPHIDGSLVYLISGNPDSFREVLTNTKLFVKLPAMNDLFNEVVGESIISVEGEKWKKERRLLTPLFHFGTLKRYNSIFDDLGKEMVESFRAKKGEPMATTEFKNWTIKAMVRAAFGDGIDPAKIDKAQEDLIAALNQVFILTTFLGGFIKYFPLPSWFKARKARSIVQAEIRKLVDQRKKDLQKTDEPFDLISTMLCAKEPVSEDFIINEGMVFLFAGRDTSATLMEWLAYFLAKYPDIQTKMYDEITQVLKESPNQSIDVLLAKFAFCRKVMLETLRLKPPAPGVDRKAAEDCELAGVKIQKGNDIILLFHNAHLDPRLWDKPLEFIPERWEKEDNFKHPFAFVPFNAGERNCIGQKMAQNEVLILFIHLIKNFKIESPNNLNDIVTGLAPLLTPMKLQVKFIPRE